MYEETKSSIDWKGMFLKVIIAFLIVLIAVKGYTTLKGNDNKSQNTTTETTAESKSSSTFTANIEKLRDAGEKYFKENADKLPTEGKTSMITLNELIDAEVIDNLADEEGKNCDGESSYVTATKEGNKTKIKANLVCGSASSYSLVYMGENDSETKTEEIKTTTTNNGNTVTTNTTSTKTSTNKTTSTKKDTTTSCGTSCSTPSVSVNTNVSQNVTVNKDTTTKKPTTNNSNTTSNSKPTTTTTTTKAIYYTVKFNSNGGEEQYGSQSIKAKNTATNPGTVNLRGYYFLGWYLNGVKYDFSTPVTKNITLTARFVKNSNYDYYDDYYYNDYYNDYYYDDYYYDDDYYDDYYYNKYYGNNKLYTGQYTTYVSSIVWDEKGTTKVSVNHTLRVPEHIEDLDVEEVRIVKAEPTTALTNTNQIRTYRNNFRDTFLYDSNGWENDNILANHMAEININYADVDIETTRYKDIDEALDEGFDVEWSATRVKSQCRSTFTVNNLSFLCNYGIVYKVTWEYRYYR